MTKPQLRAVKPGDKPDKQKSLSLTEAVETGDPLLIALAQRRDIVKRLPDVSGPALAALHRQLSLTTKEITELEAAAAADEEEHGDTSDVPDDSFDASAI